MKLTGVVRKVHELVCVKLPIEIRRDYDIRENEGLEIFNEGENIILKKYAPTCVIVI